MADASQYMTWANLLTLVRLGAIGPCAWAVASGHWHLALGAFVIAAVSDLLDGPLARRFDQVSPLGGFFDHATDALFVTVVLGACASAGHTPWLLAALIPLAFLQYTIDSRALAGYALRTSRLGRMNGIAYFVIAGIVIAGETFSLAWLPPAAVMGLGWVLVATTAASMLDRALAWRRLSGG